MKIAGIIAEYNPFHKGHARHIELTRLLSGADGVICLMSGSFVQRGEPAFMDKFARARAALMSGADMVLELPAVYSLQAAEYFALGGVRILDSLGSVEILSFGREGSELPKIREDARGRGRCPNAKRIRFRARTRDWNTGLSMHPKRRAAWRSL